MQPACLAACQQWHSELTFALAFVTLTPTGPPPSLPSARSTARPQPARRTAAPPTAAALLPWPSRLALPSPPPLSPWHCPPGSSSSWRRSVPASTRASAACWSCSPPATACRRSRQASQRRQGQPAHQLLLRHPPALLTARHPLVARPLAAGRRQAPPPPSRPWGRVLPLLEWARWLAGCGSSRQCEPKPSTAAGTVSHRASNFYPL